MRCLDKNKSQKVVDIFAQLKNTLYLCTRFDKEKSLRKSSEGSYGEFSEKKSFKNIWRLQKFALPLHSLFVWKDGKYRLEILSKIEIKFFEDIEQLRSFIHSWKRVISNNTFEIRAKIYKQFIFTMESLILAQDER